MVRPVHNSHTEQTLRFLAGRYFTSETRRHLCISLSYPSGILKVNCDNCKLNIRMFSFVGRPCKEKDIPNFMVIYCIFSRFTSCIFFHFMNVVNDNIKVKCYKSVYNFFYPKSMFILISIIT